MLCFCFTAKTFSYTCIYTYSFSQSFPWWFIPRYWIQFPVLCRRTLSFTHLVYNSPHLLIPAPSPSLSSPPTAWQPQVCFCLWVSFSFVCVQCSWVFDDAHSPKAQRRCRCFAVADNNVVHSLLVSRSLLLLGLQHARLLCPSLSPRVCSNSCPLSQWCHPTISSSVTSFSSCPQSFPTSGSFPMSWLFTSDGQNSRVSASLSVLPMYIQGWFPLGWTGLISWLSKELSRVFSSKDS